jgi:hypothetical protein
LIQKNKNLRILQEATQPRRFKEIPVLNQQTESHEKGAQDSICDQTVDLFKQIFGYDTLQFVRFQTLDG